MRCPECVRVKVKELLVLSGSEATYESVGEGAGWGWG